MTTLQNVHYFDHDPLRYSILINKNTSVFGTVVFETTVLNTVVFGTIGLTYWDLTKSQ